MSNYLQTYTGRLFDLENFSPNLISSADIAHSLAWQCRYNGHVHTYYSVAQHCLAMWNYVKKWYPHIDYLDFMVLMHDSPEMITGDVPSPYKTHMMGDFRNKEQELLDVFFERFKIKTSPEALKIMHKLDKEIVPTEIALFLDRTVDIEQINKEWAEAIGPAMTKEEAELAFIRAYAEMYEKYAIKEMSYESK